MLLKGDLFAIISSIIYASHLKPKILYKKK